MTVFVKFLNIYIAFQNTNLQRILIDNKITHWNNHSLRIFVKIINSRNKTHINSFSIVIGNIFSDTL